MLHSDVSAPSGSGGHPGQGRAAIGSAAAGRTSGVGHFKARRVRIIEPTPVRGRSSRAENPGRYPRPTTALEAAKTQACIQSSR